MKIGVDLRCVVFGGPGGLTQWLQGAFENLISTDRENQYTVFGTPFNYHLLRVEAPNLDRVTLPVATSTRDLQDWLRQDGGYDVLFRAYPLDAELDFPPRKQVACIPDCQHEVYPENFSRDILLARRKAFHYFQASAGAIGTLTQFTRDALLADPWTECRDVFLMPPALPEVHLTPADGESRRLVPDGPFFLYPANSWPHKNHRAVLQAFARFHEQHKNVRFVFTGHADGWQPLQAEFGHLPIKHLGFITPELLAALYRRALALVYLSKFEGFGIPLLEAFDAGLPVLCSNVTALAEVGGDAVLSCDPTSIDAMAAGMVRISSDATLRDALVARGKERLRAYTWADCAAALKGAFERVGAASRARLSVSVDASPLVSIVTPSFNQGQFIRRTIDSVLSQDYPHIDYRVVDGASTDETLDVLRSYGDRVRWVSEKDSGQTNAINKGLSQAKGEIFAYLNSDDILRPGAVGKVVDYFQRRPACDVVYGRDALIDADDQYFGMYPTTPFSFSSLMEQCCISQPAAFWKARIAHLAGPFDESLYWVMDYEYWMRLAGVGACIEYWPDEILASTRVHAATKTNSRNEHSRADQREDFFRELFAVSHRHSGTISNNYLSAYTYQMLLPRLFERSPLADRHRAIAYEVALDWVRYRHRHRCRPAGCLLRTLRGARRFYWPVAKAEIQRSVTQAVRWLLRKSPPPPTPIPHVVWGNCQRRYLGSKTILPPLRDRAAGELLLSGRAACDTTLSVLAGERVLAEIPLRADEVSNVRIPGPTDAADEQIFLKFSSAVRCTIRGTYAMELYGTNLFCEKDAA